VTGNWNGFHRMWLAPSPDARRTAFVDAAPRELAAPSPIRTGHDDDADDDDGCE
jgi:hypothetical protein